MRMKRVLADVAAWVGKRYEHKGKRGESPSRFWDTVLTSYYEDVRRRCRTTHLPGYAPAIPIKQIFIPIYVLEDPTARHCFDVTRFHTSAGRFRYAERVDALSFVQQPRAQRLFLLGKIGAGKTTFLKYLALQALDSKNVKIPFYLSLKDWSDCGLSLLDFIAQQFKSYTDMDAHAYLEDKFKEGQGLLLLDGLDEIGQAGDARRRVTERLMNFSEFYPACQYVIACRSIACEYGFEPFTYAEITDFDMDQIRLFVSQWFRENHKKRDQLIHAFTKEENRALRNLGRTPLHLALLCLNFNATHKIPARRFELYEASIDILLRRRRLPLDVGPTASVYRDLVLARKRQLLEQVANIAFREGDRLRQATLEKYLESYLQPDGLYPPEGIYPHTDRDGDKTLGAEALNIIEKQQGIFIQREPGIHTFAHQTFQNYFMARYILDHLADNTLVRLMHHITDDHWQEVFLLTASALDDPTAFFEMFRRAIDDLIRGDEGIEDFLWWSTQKAKAIIVDVNPPALRGLYCYLDLALACPMAMDHDIVRARDLALAIARALDRGLAMDLALDLGVNLAFALDRDRANVKDRARIRTLDQALARVRASVRTRATDREIRDNIEAVLDLSQAMDFTDLQRALTALEIPEDGAPEEVWASFADAVRRLMITHRGVGRDWSFTKQQSARLAAYFSANYLLVQCLDLASADQNHPADQNRPADQNHPADQSHRLKSTLLLPPGGL